MNIVNTVKNVNTITHSPHTLQNTYVQPFNLGAYSIVNIEIASFSQRVQLKGVSGSQNKRTSTSPVYSTTLPPTGPLQTFTNVFSKNMFDTKLRQHNYVT